MKRGDWVVRKGDDRRPQIGRVRNVLRDDEGSFLSVVLYDLDGEYVGRESPPEGGPTSFEPACPAEDWERIAKPKFPVAPVPDGLYENYRAALKVLS